MIMESFNFEGGCYAKVINLDKESEPDIYNAIKENALLENVTLDAEGKIDFADKSVTENTRVSYPIDHIEKIVRPVSAAPAAKEVIFLSADAFGVLPPVSILTPEQTQYYFLSGFTAKLAGTERGITEPTRPFPHVSDRHSWSCIRQNMRKSLLREWSRAERRHTLSIPDGTAQESVSQLKIHVVSLTQF